MRGRIIIHQITGYFAAEGFEESLRRELKEITHEYGRLFLAKGPPQKVYWAQNIWFDPQIISFHSIFDAAKKLRELQKLWSFYPYRLIRKGALITEKLPFFSPKPIIFPSIIPAVPLGSWTLLDEKTLLASPHCSSPFAQGAVYFQETKQPPSRAYLKLWEALIRSGSIPKSGDSCLEVGASPGSWTWVLQKLGTYVVAVDRAFLSESIQQLPQITFIKKDAFSIVPNDFPDLNWIFSDLICYPDKLLSWIKQWISIGSKVNFICTLKFQGDCDYRIIKEFEEVEGSSIVHLFNNKHELTWFRICK